jgi:hypothetical protein
MSLLAPPCRPSWWLALLGSGLMLGALAWWALVFLRVIGNGYLSAREALTCSLASSVICDLATSLCGKTHPLGIAWYSPVLLWASVALLSAAALLTRDAP